MLKEMLKGIVFAGCFFSLSAFATVDFTDNRLGTKNNGYTVGGISFFTTVVHGPHLSVHNSFEENFGNVMTALGPPETALRMTFAPSSHIDLAFGNDYFRGTHAGGLALLKVFSGTTLVGSSEVLLNRNDTMDQTISFDGASFDSANFSYVDASYSPYVAASETVDNININILSPIPEPETYAMLLVGLGLVGWWVAWRRRSNAS